MLLSSSRNSANRQPTSGWTFRSSEVQSSQILAKSSWIIISLLRFVTHLGISSILSILNGKSHVSLISCWWIPIFPNTFIHCWLVLSQYLYPQSQPRLTISQGLRNLDHPRTSWRTGLGTAWLMLSKPRIVTKDERNNVPRLNMDPEYMRTEIQRSYTKQKVVISLTKKDLRDLRVLVPQIMIQNMQKYDIVIYRKLDLIGLKCDLLYEVAVWALAWIDHNRNRNKKKQHTTFPKR